MKEKENNISGIELFEVEIEDFAFCSDSDLDWVLGYAQEESNADDDLTTNTINNNVDSE